MIDIPMMLKENFNQIHQSFDKLRSDLKSINPNVVLDKLNNLMNRY